MHLPETQRHAHVRRAGRLQRLPADRGIATPDRLGRAPRRRSDGAASSSIATRASTTASCPIPAARTACSRPGTSCSELGLKPLIVRFDHWFYRPLIAENNTRTFKQLGVDVLNFTPNWHVVRELMLEVAEAPRRLLLALPHRHLRLPDADGDPLRDAADRSGASRWPNTSRSIPTTRWKRSTRSASTAP